MTDTQLKTARHRLALGISNVGFWVLVSVAGLVWLGPSNTPPIRESDLVKWLLAAVAFQGLFDWVGGTVFMPPVSMVPTGFLFRWLRGVLVHSALLAATGFLGYWSYRLSGGFGSGVALSSLGLFWGRRQIFGLVSGARVRPAAVGDAACRSAQAQDPSFTGGVCGAGLKATVLLPELWERSLTGSEMETVLQRRLWEVQNWLPARALLFVLSWNLAGSAIGSFLLDIPGRAPEPALLLQCCWMTLWGFVGLLLLPTASRSAVFAADHAAAAKGCDAAGWIRRFPEITGEDGNAKTVLQRVFYPIPSARERLHWLGPPLPCRCWETWPAQICFCRWRP